MDGPVEMSRVPLQVIGDAVGLGDEAPQVLLGARRRGRVVEAQRWR